MEEAQQKSVPAWLVRINGQAVSLGNSELSMLLEAPETSEVLGAPAHCNQLLVLEANLYPIVDMSSLLERDSVDSKVVGLVAYFDQFQGQAVYGALRFDTIPERILVTDEMQVEISDIDTKLHPFVRAAYKYQSQAVGVLDLTKIFNFNNSINSEGRVKL